MSSNGKLGADLKSSTDKNIPNDIEDSDGSIEDINSQEISGEAVGKLILKLI